MNPPPFVRLTTPRRANRPDLPVDLEEFYSWHEGVGRGCEPDYTVRLHALREVVRVDWAGLGLISDVPEGWEKFDAWWIGFGLYFEEIVYVVSTPAAPPGSILAIGGSQDCPLVLATTFDGWLAHLERWGWAEPGIVPAWDLSSGEQAEVRQHYLALNPGFRVDDIARETASEGEPAAE